MNYQTYQSHAVRCCKTGLPMDPIITLSAYRDAMRSPAARKFGTNPYRRDYVDTKARVTAKCFGLLHAENLYRDSILASAARPLGLMAA